MAHMEIDRLMEHARIRCPGATDDGIKLELFRAVDEFLRGSEVWKEEIDVVVSAGVTTYDVIPVDYGLVHRLLWVKDASGNLSDAYSDEPGVLILRTAPSAPATYKATVCKTVSEPLTRDGYPQIPDWVWSRHNTDLEDGLLMRMLTQVGKPWASAEVAAIHATRFSAAIVAARADLRHADAILDDAKAMLPGVMDSDLRREFFRVAQDFLKTTDVWLEEISISVVANTVSYAITPTGGLINRLMWVLNENGTVVPADMQVPGTVVMRITPSVSATWKATVAKTVADPISIPSWIVNKHSDVLRDGLLSRMFAQATKPYANTQLAVFHGRNYAAGKAQARVDARHHNIHGGQRWKFPRFA